MDFYIICTNLLNATFLYIITLQTESYIYYYYHYSYLRSSVYTKMNSKVREEKVRKICKKLHFIVIIIN